MRINGAWTHFARVPVSHHFGYKEGSQVLSNANIWYTVLVNIHCNWYACELIELPKSLVSRHIYFSLAFVLEVSPSWSPNLFVWGNSFVYKCIQIPSHRRAVCLVAPVLIIEQILPLLRANDKFFTWGDLMTIIARSGISWFPLLVLHFNCITINHSLTGLSLFCQSGCYVMNYLNLCFPNR